MSTTGYISKIMGLIMAAGIIVPTMNGMATAQETASETYSKATIVIQGTGIVTRKPEFARVILNVSARSETIPEASAASKEASKKVLEKLKAFKIADTDIKTLNMDVSISRKSSGKFSGSSEDGYRTSQQFELILRDQTTVGQVIGELLAIDNVRVQSLFWDIEKSQEVDDEARKAAVVDARHRAEIYTQAAGTKLGKVLQIREGGGARPFNQPVAYGAMAAPAGVSASPAAEMPVVPPSELTFESGIYIVWELQP
ncbi:SIMPL domain-containing protein [Microvirga sp. W0021]|uniref:SIMPL domain-containing protein n=1 Tax=Hohaiivirga grylli TaxID=3133970 RepID=A0ABV0BF97_9HYPH